MNGAATENISPLVPGTDSGQPGRVPKTTVEALAAFRYLLRRFIRLSEERALKVGITPQQYQLVLAVEGQPGRDWATINDLADALQIQHHAAVGLAGRCVDNGLVIKTRDSEDRRQVCVSVTDKGRSVLAAVAGENLRELKDLLLSLEMLFHDGSVDLRQAEAAASAVSAMTP